MKYFFITICLWGWTAARAVQICEKEIYETEFLIGNGMFKDEYLAIWYPAVAGSHHVIQMCSNVTGLPIERRCSLNREGQHGLWDVIDRGMELFDCSVITNNCVEESFDHYYLMRNKATEKHANKWPKGKIGKLSTPIEPCLLATGLPVTRRCIYNAKHYMAEWEKKEFKNIKCLREIRQDIVTYDLNNLFYEVEGNKTEQSAKESMVVAKELSNLLAKANTVRIPTDLEIATNILDIITTNSSEIDLVPKVLNVTNLLMESNEKVVLSSMDLDTPKSLLKTVDSYFDRMTNIVMPTSKCNNIPEGVKYNAENFTSVFYINPACSNVSGIAVYSASAHVTGAMHYDSSTNTYIRYLHLNESLDDIVQEPHMEVATYFPEKLWNTLRKEAEGKTNLEAVRISMYKNKNFFVNQVDQSKAPTSIVLTISIPGYTGDLPGYVPLIFQHHHTRGVVDTPQCGYYDLNRWNTSSVIQTAIPDVALCKTNHLKSFGALLGHHYRPRIHTASSALLTTIMVSALDVISVAGCSLSLFGLLCIWFTAVCCKDWRSQSSNQLLLNICFVLTLMMIYFLFINLPAIRHELIDVNNIHHCIAEGAFLQYLILVLFLWMLIIAILQYRRYVTVLGVARPPNAVFKFALAAWGLPLLPTGLVIFLDPYSYTNAQVEGGICYPTGRSLYFAVLLPISLIMVVNIGIFLYILCSVRRSLKKFSSGQHRQGLVYMQLRLSILLFFVLGISWVFGILAHIDGSGVLSLLFCLTSTLQGFILFIYFVVYDQSVRQSWVKYCCAGDYYTLEDSGTKLTSFNEHSRSK